MRITITIETDEQPDDEPTREVDMGSIVERAEPPATLGFHVLPPRTDEQ